jgi:hypothetical protein
VIRLGLFLHVLASHHGNVTNRPKGTKGGRQGFEEKGEIFVLELLRKAGALVFNDMRESLFGGVFGHVNGNLRVETVVVVTEYRER